MNGSSLHHADAITLEHRALIHQVVSKKVPPDHVDDVVQNALERAVRSLREMPSSPANLDAWLTKVAQRCVADFWRDWKRRDDRETDLGSWSGGPPLDPDPSGKIISAVGAHQFLSAAANLMSARDRQALPLYLRLQNDQISGATMAEILGIAPRNFYKFLADWRPRFREALLVLAYFTELGVDQQCDVLVAERQRTESPTLRKAVARHIARCSQCAEHRAAMDKRIRSIASAVPIVLPPSIVIRPKIVLSAASIAAGVCFLVTSLHPGANRYHDAIPLVATSPVSVTAAPTTAAATTTAGQLRATVVAPVPSVRHRASTTPRPATTTAVPPAEPAGLTITVPADAIDHHRIAVLGCAAPTTTAFTVTVTGPVAQVAAQLRNGDHGRSELLTSRNGTSTWTGTVGPYRSADDGDSIRIAVVAIGRDGEVRAAVVGTVRLTTCQQPRYPHA